MNPRVHWQLRVEDAALDSKLFQKQFEAVTSVSVINKDDAFSLNQLKLEYDVYQEELFVLRASRERR
jgi:hypothetical protein